MKLLVTGGAGYIGSHTCKLLAAQGHEPVVYDNLCTGHRHLVRWGEFVHGDIRDSARLRQCLARHKPDGVIHFASSIAVGESVQHPGMYYDNNVYGSLQLLQALRDEGVRPLVVSSSAAVYGVPKHMPLSEATQALPINPYGRTKLIMEWMLEDFAAAHNVPWMSLRYFNAAGADPEGETGECHEPETHIIPNMFRAITEPHAKFQLFGNDYNTPDGTCIRDYIHVLDLAAAHILAVKHLLAGNPSQALNLGSEHGASVKELLDLTQQLTGKQVPYTVEGRRQGDPAVLIADATDAHSILGWYPRYSDIKNILSTAWRWHTTRHQ